MNAASGAVALAAYLITYNEYQHHSPDRKRVRRAALEAAAFAFLFFVVLAVLAGILISFFSPS